MSCSTSVTNPYLYSVFASCSMTSVDVLMVLSSSCQRHGPKPGLGSVTALTLARLRRKAFPAPARALRVRVLQREARRQQVALVEVEHRAVEQLQTARVDEDLRAAGAFEDVVGRARCASQLKT